jgi:hypothetical protein
MMAIVAIAAFCAPLIYAAITHHVWEDYLITFRFSENLASGKGLVYNPPERVHGFTSPIGVLLPALLHLISGRGSYLVTLGLFRVVSAAAFAAAAALLFDAVKIGTRRIWPAIAVVMLLLLEPKSVAFSANGQESAFMLLWAAAGIRLSLDAPSTRWKWWAMIGAGFQWTRPEGFLYCAAFAVPNFIFAREARRDIARAFAKAAGLAIALYLPWVIFTTIYYGSPIPQTMLAKAVVHNPHGTLVKLIENIPSASAGAFENVYFFMDPWPMHVRIVAMAIAIFSLIYWLIPTRDRLGRIASFCFFALSPYFAFLSIPYGWYYPSFAIFGLVALCSGLDAIAGDSRALRRVAATALVAIALERVVFFYDFTRVMKTQQLVIEDHNRTQIGLYLHDRVKPNETVMLECLGYIGYFSNAHMLEWPGLVSPQVTRLLKQHAKPIEVINALHPDWLVLRPFEVEKVADEPTFTTHYHLERIFDVTPEVEAFGDRPGHVYIEGDETFLVFHRV